MSHSQTKRKPHKRSRKGCTRCKGRHVRCDEVVPICGNCFKYGHECSLSETRPFEIDIMSPNDFATPEPEEGTGPSDTNDSQQSQQSQYPQYPQYSQQPQQSQYSQYPQHTQSYAPSYSHAIPYHDPLRSDLTPEAVSALNCYLQVCAESPLPTYCNQMVRTEEDPKLYSPASDHDFVRDSVMASASTLHFELTHCLQSRQMSVEYLHTALRGLQKAVETMSPTNTDAILIASFCLSWGAQNWQEWCVYASGYSKILRRVRKLKQETVYSSLLHDNFQVIKFETEPKMPRRYPPTSNTYTDSELLVEQIVTSLFKARRILSAEEWDENGFKHFEILCWTIHSTLEDPEHDGGFKKLGLLRACMFFFDLSVMKDFGLRNILRIHLYGLVLAMVPYFPHVCIEDLERFCRTSIKKMRKGYMMGARPASELTEIFWRDELFC